MRYIIIKKQFSQFGWTHGCLYTLLVILIIKYAWSHEIKEKGHKKEVGISRLLGGDKKTIRFWHIRRSKEKDFQRKRSKRWVKLRNDQTKIDGIEAYSIHKMNSQKFFMENPLHNEAYLSVFFLGKCKGWCFKAI